MIERSVGTWKMDVADYGGRSRPAWTKLYVFVCLSETFVLEVEMLTGPTWATGVWSWRRDSSTGAEMEIGRETA